MQNKGKTNSEDRIAEFISVCREKFGVNMNSCDNDLKIYHAELRSACEANSCGNYGKCHTCPPNIGSAEECIQKTSSYNKILVFQKTYTIEDSFDYYGMVAAQKQFKMVQQGIAELARETFKNPLVLGAGGCMLCESCAAKDGHPCRFPEKALSSLEAYCIQVSELSALAGIKYKIEQNTISYFGGVFLAYFSCILG